MMHSGFLILQNGEFYKKIMRDRESWRIEAKLDGDRLLVQKANNGRVGLFNKHGDEFNHPNFMHINIPNNTCLDGEFYKKVFYPFDCLQWNGEKITHRTLRERLTILYHINKINTENKHYGRIPVIHNEDPIQTARANNWEGVVFKNKSSAYPLSNFNFWYKIRI